MGIFDFLRRRKQLPVNAPSTIAKLPNVSGEKKSTTDRYQSWYDSKLKTRFSRNSIVNIFKREPNDPTNVPNKAYNRLNLASKEARRREMQKRRASLQYRPTAPFGRR